MNIVVLTHNEASIRYLLSHFDPAHQYTVVLEQGSPRKALLKKLRRFVRQRGLWRGSLRFARFLGDLPYLMREARSQEAYLTKHLGRPEFPAQMPIHTVTDINDPQVVQLVKQARPELVIVFGTSIIKRHVIEAISAPGRLLVNNHVGITPEYRGVKSEFYCLLNDQPEMAGSTIHVLDVGLDNGEILLQKHLDLSELAPQQRYDYRHLRLMNIEMTAGMFNELIAQVAQGDIPRFSKLPLCSRVYSTPTKAQYLRYYSKVEKYLSQVA